MRDREKERNIRLPESYVQQGGPVRPPRPSRARRAAQDGAAQGQGRDLQAHGAGLFCLGGLGSLRLGPHGGTAALRPDLLAGLLAPLEVVELALDAGVGVLGGSGLLDGIRVLRRGAVLNGGLIPGGFLPAGLAVGVMVKVLLVVIHKSYLLKLCLYPTRTLLPNREEIRRIV